jgi:hypothetical protein
MYKCNWCGEDHDAHDKWKRDEVALFEAMKATGLIHIFISNEPRECPLCGSETEVRILPIASKTGAHPYTPIKGHKGKGCIGPWIHNKELMGSEGLEVLPLPCFDEYCNKAWEPAAKKAPPQKSHNGRD